MRFEKWQALGNDYLIVESTELSFDLTTWRIRRLCEGHFGVDADGLLLLEHSKDQYFVARLRIYNPDGSEAELSGNGAREAILYLRRRGWTDQNVFSIQTAAGEIRPTITGPDTCRVEMGRATLTSKDFPDGPDDGRGDLVAGGQTWSFQHVSIGNPQCAIHVKDFTTLQALDLQTVGPPIMTHKLFPNRTNVSWYTEVPPGPSGRTTIRARIFERGVGETLSSGTGATGAAIAYRLSGGSSEVTVQLDGGELDVEIGADLQVNLTGWARPVFEGRLSDDFVKELEAE
jgi:diaminopimelate epimerase